MMHRTLSTKIMMVAFAVCALGAACSSDSSTEPVPLSALNGIWSAASTEVPGLSYQFSLTLSGSSASGSGNWSAGTQSGIVTVTGSATDNAVTLDLTLGHSSPGTLPFLNEHFAGKLKSATKLEGTVTSAAGGGQQTYSKTGS